MGNRRKTRADRLKQTMANSKGYAKQKADMELRQLELQKQTTQMDELLKKR